MEQGVPLDRGGHSHERRLPGAAAAGRPRAAAARHARRQRSLCAAGGRCALAPVLRHGMPFCVLLGACGMAYLRGIAFLQWSAARCRHSVQDQPQNTGQTAAMRCCRPSPCRHSSAPCALQLPAYAALMKRCWAHNPYDRPSFEEVIHDLRCAAVAATRLLLPLLLCGGCAARNLPPAFLRRHVRPRRLQSCSPTSIPCAGACTKLRCAATALVRAPEPAAAWGAERQPHAVQAAGAAARCARFGAWIN